MRRSFPGRYERRASPPIRETANDSSSDVRSPNPARRAASPHASVRSTSPTRSPNPLSRWPSPPTAVQRASRASLGWSNRTNGETASLTAPLARRGLAAERREVDRRRELRRCGSADQCRASEAGSDSQDSGDTIECVSSDIALSDNAACNDRSGAPPERAVPHVHCRTLAMQCPVTRYRSGRDEPNARWRADHFTGRWCACSRAA